MSAHTSCWTSVPNVAFMGTSLTGAFGETWDIVAVASWPRLVALAQHQDQLAVQQLLPVPQHPRWNLYCI